MALLDLQSPNGLCLKPQQNCPEYSVFPNIWGSFQTINGWIFSDTYGAISKIGGVDTTNIVQLRAQETRPKTPGIAFSAQASNSIYGSASTVQTAALFVQCLIRYVA